MTKEEEEVIVEDVAEKEEEDAAKKEEEGEQQNWKKSLNSVRKAEGKPIKWLLDRCNGRERIMNPHSKPCCSLLYPNGFLKLFPGLMEVNCFMESFGKIGFIHDHHVKLRRLMFFFAMCLSSCGWIFILCTDMAMSKHYDVLRRFHLSKGKVDLAYVRSDGGADRVIVGTNDIYVGVTSVAWRREWVDISREDIATLFDTLSPEDFATQLVNYTKSEEKVNSMSDFCDGESRIFFVEKNQCNDCNDASEKMVISLTMATIFFFFTFKNDWLRFWPNYDVNCQKFMSVCVGAITALLLLRTFIIYRNTCFNSFWDGNYCYDSAGIRVGCPIIYLDVNDPRRTNATQEELDASLQLGRTVTSANLSWDAGPAYILLGLAVFIRIYSVITNFIVPTPPITRDRNMQWEYERFAKRQDDMRNSQSPAEREYFTVW